MTSGYIPPKDEPGPDEILAALREALEDNPRLTEMPEEEVTRQLVLEGRLEGDPSPPLVAEALRTIEAEEGNLA
jgi:hypothetical protein